MANRVSLRRKIAASLMVSALLTYPALPVLAAEPALPADRPNANAGTIRSSLEAQKLKDLPKNNVSIEVEHGQEQAPAADEGAKMHVNGFRITGQTLFSQDELQEVVKDAAGKDLSLTEIYAVARTVADYLNKRGYMVANAYVPAQDIKDGMVEIAVVPGQYGDIDIRNQSRLRPQVLKRLLSAIKTGDYVKKDVLERALLLLSDTSGVATKATLAPGKETGTTDLIVEITDTEDMIGTFSLDNYGNRYTGSGVNNMALSFNNASGQGDTFILGNNYSGNGMNNTNVSYQTPVGNQGIKLGVNFYTMRYTLGKEFANYKFDGKSQVGGLFGTYPLVRSRDNNLNVVFGLDYRKLSDRMAEVTLDKKHDYLWTLGVNGDSRDNSGINTYSLGFSRGSLSFDGGTDPWGLIPAETVDRLTAQTAGSYTKTNMTFFRQQNINPRLNLIFDFSGQLAGKNLDSSQKLYIGGGKGVRAYPEGEACGDSGYILRNELRWNLPTSDLELAAYYDTGHVTINQNPWPGAGDNSRTLSGAGVGILVSSQKDYTIRVDYAWKTGSAPVTTEADRKGRWWLLGVQYF